MSRTISQADGIGNAANLADSIKIFADGANVDEMTQLAQSPYVRGLTTNPSLMRASGVTDYREFARKVLNNIGNLPVSFEVLADDPATIFRQAMDIASWGDNVYVKIPAMTTSGESLMTTSRRATEAGAKVNVTAVFTAEQAEQAVAALAGSTPGIISVFAGRIADSGRDPVFHVKNIVEMTASHPEIEILWASTRELFSITQAISAGADIITADPKLLAGISKTGTELEAFSKLTVKQFFDDANLAGYKL